LTTVEPIQDRVDAPEVPVRLVGVRVHTKLAELVLTARFVVPPAVLLMVMVDVATEPSSTTRF
jgi:hypothetical protein